MEKNRFYLLDGLRGLAAFAVMIYHYTQHNGLHYFGGAWGAVDLFFILSGFVIAHSYTEKISNGMSFQQFLSIRLIRLAPLYTFGLALGLTAIVITVSTTPEVSISSKEIIKAGLLGLVWLPYFNNLSWPFGNESIVGPVFPLNDPAWSLFFELIVNIAFFVYVQRFKKIPQIKFVCTAIFIFLFCTFVFRQTNPGWGVTNFIFGFPRVIAEFFGGALIYATGIHKKRFSTPFVLFIGTVTFCGFLTRNSQIALICSLILVPLTVIVLSTITVNATAKPVCSFLGDISYPLYIIHFPIYRLVHELVDFRTISSAWQTLLILIICSILAIALMRADSVIRNKLNIFFLRS
jgi:peptidoglycan/LPS O-acetylase OafA/YrhL